MPDMNTSSKLSRPEDITAIEPEINPTENLPVARIAADAIANKEAFCFISIVILFNAY
jgi:hypothetical protein